jgi:3-dehydroquinate dehydratase type II
MRILVLNGPNINLIGGREPDIYGEKNYPEIVAAIQRHCRERGVEAEVRQSNHEGALVDFIQEAAGTFDGIVINPAAFTHTSVALLDAVRAVGIPTVEVHLSDPDKREAFRRVSFIREACIGTVKGKGWAGYLEAVDRLLDHLSDRRTRPG